MAVGFMGYHEASAISNAPAKDQKCHKLTFSIHSLFIQRVSIPFLSGLSSNMLVMIQQVWNCVLVLFVQKLWIFWHLSCLTLMFVSMFDLLSTDKAQKPLQNLKGFSIHFRLDFFFLFIFWLKSILGTISWQFVLEFWIWSYLFIERGKSDFRE